MNWKVKAGIVAGVVMLFAALAFIIYHQHQQIVAQQALKQQVVDMKQMQNGIVRAQASYTTKDDLKQFAKDNGLNLDEIQKDLKTLHAELKGINLSVANTPGYSGTNISSTSTTPRPVTSGNSNIPAAANPYGYLSNTQKLSLNEPMSDGTTIPFGQVGFSAWKKAPWDLTIKPRQYKALTVLSEDSSGRHFVHNKLVISVDGKDHVLPISSSEFKEQYPLPSFRFDPHLALGLDAGASFKPLHGEFTPNVQLSFFSYGRTKVNPDWLFLGLGAGYETQSKNVAVMITPLEYNVGKVLPLVNNLYVGPSVSIDPAGNFSVMGGLRVGL